MRDERTEAYINDPLRLLALVEATQNVSNDVNVLGKYAVLVRMSCKIRITAFYFFYRLFNEMSTGTKSLGLGTAHYVNFVDNFKRFFLVNVLICHNLLIISLNVYILLKVNISMYYRNCVIVIVCIIYRFISI